MCVNDCIPGDMLDSRSCIVDGYNAYFSFSQVRSGYSGKQHLHWKNYHQIFDMSHTKSQNLNVSHLVLQLSLCNLLKPGVKSKMKM